MTRRLTCGLSLFVLAHIAACASTGGGSGRVEPAPILEARELGGCTYERLGTIRDEDRTGLTPPTEAEIRRTIGMRARRMGADAVIELRWMRAGPTTGSATGRTTTVSRAEAVAIRFTSPSCPRG